LDTGTDSESFALLFILLTELSTPQFLFYAANAVILTILLMLSAAISGSEIALFSLSAEDCERYRASQTWSERTSIRLLDQPKLLLATILIFNNFVNVSFVTISTYLAWDIFQTKNLSWEIVLGLTLVVTLVILFFGELLPKVYANQRGMNFLRLSIHIINFGFYTFRMMGISPLLVSTSNLVERRVKRKGYKIHIDELPDMIDEIPIDDNTSAKDKEILKGIVNFSNIMVKEIMTSRVNVSAIEVTTPFNEVIEEIRKSGYSRVPVYQDSLDKIEGVLYIKDLLPHLNAGADFEWTQLIRPRYFVPGNKKIDKLLREFQAKHVHMAIVVDEYGGTAGLITMEDIMEEIVGEINDEYDEIVPMYHTKIDENTYLFEGKIDIYDFCRVLDVDDDYFEDVKGESKSLAGLLLELFSRFPKLNETIQYEKFHFTIVSTSAKKIKVIKVKILEESKMNE
jgi:gliding motility-associated protein GldE